MRGKYSSLPWGSKPQAPSRRTGNWLPETGKIRGPETSWHPPSKSLRARSPAAAAGSSDHAACRILDTSNTGSTPSPDDRSFRPRQRSAHNCTAPNTSSDGLRQLWTLRPASCYEYIHFSIASTRVAHLSRFLRKVGFHEAQLHGSLIFFVVAQH